MPRPNRIIVSTSAATWLLVASAAHAQTLQPVLYSSIPGAPTANEPGGGTFLSGTSSPFSKMVSSPGGNYWALIARRAGGSSGNYAVIRGSGDGIGATVVAETGGQVPAPLDALTFLTGTTGTTRGLNLDELAVHDSGAVAYSGQTSGTPKQVLCVASPSGDRIERTGAELLPGLLVTAGGSPSTNAAIIDTSNNASFRGLNMFDSTRVAFQTFSIVNLTAPQNFAAYGSGSMGAMLMANDLLNQQAVTPITGGAGTLNGHVGGSLGFVPDGSSWVMRGTETSSSSTPQILRNGTITYEFGSPIPILSGDFVASTSGGLGTPVLDANDNLYIPAQTVAGVRVLLRNDRVIAMGATPIFPGSTTAYVPDRAFLVLAAPNGRYAVLNYTQTFPTNIRVCVVDGQTLVAKTGDPVDLNNDGINNDGYEIKDLDPSASTFSADGYLYLGVTLQQTGLTATVGGAILRIAAPAAVCSPEWLPAEQGVDGTVNAVLSVPGVGVFVGGSFSTADGVPANNVALYDTGTSTWSALGAGTDGPVSVLATIPGGDIMVGGAFLNANGAPANGIARYNPSTGVWSTLGTSFGGGVAGNVFAIATLSNGDLAVGGSFGTADGVPVANVAIYRPSTNTWSAASGPSGGTDGEVRAIVPVGTGDFIAGGAFSNAGGGSAFNIARWNSSTDSWSALGAGTVGPVATLAVLSGGDVIVGGSFTDAGGAPASNIARVNPSTLAWSTLGTGTDGPVNALATSGSAVFAGGSFTTAGGVAASRIARFDTGTNTWSALGFGADDNVNAISLLGAPYGSEDLAAGGGFTSAGGLFANRIAAWIGQSAPSIASQPVSIPCVTLANPFFEIGYSGFPEPFFQWQWKAPGAADWSALVNGEISNGAGTATVSGVRTPRIDIVPSGSLNWLRTAEFRVVVTNACGTITSNPGKFVPCTANFDCTGTVDVVDLFDFLDAWFAQNGGPIGTPSADFDGDTDVDVVDLFDFLDAWFAQVGVCG